MSSAPRAHIRLKTSGSSPGRSLSSTRSSGLPRFDVNVLFTELPKESFLIGGEPAEDFVRISIDEIARSVPDGAQALWMKRIRKTVAPFTTERGLRWEVHIDDTPNDLWLLDGFFPPAQGSEDEKRWALENRPSELTGR